MGKIKIDNYTAKEAMSRVIEYMKLESVQTIEIVTMDMLKCYQKEHEWQEEIFDITVAESRAVLEAVGIDDEKLINEAENHLFIKMFMRFLHKNRVKVFLLAENQKTLSELENFIQTECAKVEVVETATMETHGVSDDMILNRINGVEADCVLASLSSPEQQEFIARNRMLVNARIWVGLGTKLNRKEKKRPGIRQIKETIGKYFSKQL